MKTKEESLSQHINRMWERVTPARKEYWRKVLEDSSFVDDFFDKNKKHFLKK